MWGIELGLCLSYSPVEFSITFSFSFSEHQRQGWRINRMWQTTRNGVLSVTVALSLTIVLAPASDAVSPINSTQDGRIIQGGTYYNTPGKATSFINSHSGGLWLKAGTTIRGLGINSSGALTNNGGVVHLYAPDNVVRIDGNIDVNAVRNGQGAYLGSGGQVYIDSGYLFQNGNIFANGLLGGLVQVNVAAMTMGAGAQIQAKGSIGTGGTVAINSAGPVDIRRGALVDTSGTMPDLLEGNLINIEGGLVNNEGTLRADGVNSRGGTIRLVATGQSPYQDIKDNLQSATVNPPGDASAPTISANERTFLLQRTKGLIDNHEGQIFLSRDTSSTTPAFISNLSANGNGGNEVLINDYTQSYPDHRTGDGGTIILLAKQGIQNLGTVKANGSAGTSGASPINGGNGGTISFVSQADISNTQGRLEANGGNGGASTGTTLAGTGGDGGLMAFSYNTTISNTGGIYADGALGGNGSNPGRGGNGGLMVFSGNNNPTGNGSLDVIARPGGNNNLNLGGKSGTLVSPNPGTLGQTQAYFQQGYVNGQLARTGATQQTQPVELLTHAENLMMLTKNGGSISVAENLFDRLLQARIRSVPDPTGSLGQAQTEVIHKNTITSFPYVYRNLTLGSSRDNLALDMSHPWNSSGGPGELIFPSPLSMGEGFSTLNTLSVINDGSISTQYLFGGAGDASYMPTNYWVIGRNTIPFGGGRLSVLANGNVDNLNLFGTTGLVSGGSVNIAAQGTLINRANLTTTGNVHGGSIMVKAGSDIVMDNAPYYAIPGISSNGGLLGGTIRLLPMRDFRYLGGVYVTSINANGNLQGGVINVNADRDSLITNGDFGFPETQPTLTANGTSSTLGRGGFIHINAGNNNVHSNASFQATGGLANGTVLFTTNP
jgi:hypothetical protein